MNKGIVYIATILIITLLSACAVEFQSYELKEDFTASLHYKGSDAEDGQEEEDENSDLVGVPALTYYSGDLKRGAIWWAGKGIALQKGDIYVINAFDVGPDTVPFGATFPPLDLKTEKAAIKITAKAEGKDGATPTMFMLVGDADGYQSNAELPTQVIENSKDFKEYYFDASDIFMQAKPKKHKVNAAMINSIKFFINLGQPGFSGKIHIKEIKIVPIASIPQ